MRNALDLYSGGAWFESRSRHKLFSLRFQVGFHSPSRQIPRYYLHYVVTIPFQILCGTKIWKILPNFVHKMYEYLCTSYSCRRKPRLLPQARLCYGDGVRFLWGTNWNCIYHSDEPNVPVRVRVFNVGLLARSVFASGRTCDRPTRSRFSVVFLRPIANAELVRKFHVALHASHAALTMVTSKFPSNAAFPMSDHSDHMHHPLPEGRAGTAWEP
jgi:hypothetical protein